MATQDSKKNLLELFSGLRGRLFNINNYEVTDPDETSKIWFSGIVENIYAYETAESSPFIGSMIDLVDTSIHLCEVADNVNLDKIIKKIRALEPKTNYRIAQTIAEEDESYRRQALNILTKLVKELNGYKEVLYMLNEEIYAMGETGPTNKLRLNLSVKEIAGLLRVFREENIIDNKIDNTMLADIFFNHFSSKNGGGTGRRMVINALNPDVDTLEKLQSLFNQLAKKAEEILEKKEQ
ncbi:MAG TPA: hypothetical protein PLU17_03960 [Chitinophagaceae bacterium]|nr:hypothetical protein [Chitinophagaceae bacterium]